jgi:tripartite-type tricarboxylate transporter receptor subunit TctC
MRHLNSCAGPMAFATLALTATGALAQSDVGAFYKGKTVEMVVGYAAGSSNDIAARALARNIGKHLPGNPTVITRNMPGGGSFIAANYVYNVAPKDGTVLGLMAPTLPIDEKLGTPGVKYVASKFNWIGRETTSVGVSFTWHTSPTKTIEDAMKRETPLAATGAGSTTSIYPNVLNNLAGTKFKLIMGYVGSNEAMLAMERGETEAHSTAWEQVTSQHPDWVKDKKINILVQYALAKHPALPDVPLAVDLVKSEEGKRIMRAVVAAADVGKSVLTSPGVPPERVAALRAAFDAAIKDPDFISDFETSRIEIIPMQGAELQKVVEELGALPPDLVDKVRKVYEMPGVK